MPETLSEQLENYGQDIKPFFETARKATAAIKKLQKSVYDGDLRNIEKLRQNASHLIEKTYELSGELKPFEFDTHAYLSPEGEFFNDLITEATAKEVSLFPGEGVIFCYPFLLRSEAEKSAVRLDKKLVYTLRPEVLVEILKKAQAKEPKVKPERIIETLFNAYEYVLAKRSHKVYIDLPLKKLYDVLTLLPGTGREYTLLDFTREIYFLDISELSTTRKGFRMSLPASTVSRERSTNILNIVTRDGLQKQYSTIKFSPPDKDGELGL